MPRLRQVGRDDVPEHIQRLYDILFGGRDPVDEPGATTGPPGNWWTVLALAPDCFDHVVDGVRFYRSPRRELDRRLCELALTRAGYARGSQFVFSQHCKCMRDAGYSEAQIEAVAHWPAADCFDELERLVLAYADCLVLDGGRTPDGLFEALRSHLSDPEILELTYCICMLATHATLCRALHLEYDDEPERVVEVPEPGLDDGYLEVLDDHRMR